MAAYEFLFIFHCNYDRIILKIKRHIGNGNFSYPLPFNFHGHLNHVEFLSKSLLQTVLRVARLLDVAKIV